MPINPFVVAVASMLVSHRNKMVVIITLGIKDAFQAERREWRDLRKDCANLAHPFISEKKKVF